MEKRYIIAESDLRQLLEDSLTLTALNYGGVDSWDWYGQSIRDFEEENGEIEQTAENMLSDFSPFLGYAFD